MTAHELARKLLEMPDVIVGHWSEYGFEEANTVCSQKDIQIYGWHKRVEPLVITIES